MARHHRERWGDRPYEAFAADFEAGLEQWDPQAWAERFRDAGARYVVLVSKHHDGFCLWPTERAQPEPAGLAHERDVVGELAEAVRGVGLRFGLYYSGGLDWTFETATGRLDRGGRRVDARRATTRPTPRPTSAS